MDISTITDVKELKSLAYDATLQIQLSQQNLQTIHQRILQIEQPVQEVMSTPEQ